ncbi:MAG: hypothetical protein R2764_07365 [Bacteroidales bacterium]
MKYKLITLLLITCSLAFSAANAQVFERSRELTKTYKVYKETTLEVSNKYGNIHLFPWEKDSIKIHIEVNVKANKESKADKIYEYIDFDFSNTKYYVVAKTAFRDNKNAFWSEVSDLASTLFSGNNKAQIDYFIYLPSGMEVSFENKFGNIYTTNHSGKMTVKLSNGDFKANNIMGYANLDFKLGNVSIGQINDGMLKVSYGEVDIEEANMLVVESKSSTLKIGKLNDLKLESRRDKYYIDRIKSISGATSFSYINIEDFSNDMNLETEYGEVNFDNVESSFQLISLSSKYTDITFNVSDGFKCVLNIDHSESSGITYPESFTGLKMVEIDKKEDHFKTSGTIGTNPKPAGKINIRLWSGNVVMKKNSH